MESPVGDSGFAMSEVYETCKSNDCYHVIHLKVNKNLEKLAKIFILVGDGHPWEQREVHN